MYISKLHLQGFKSFNHPESIERFNFETKNHKSIDLNDLIIYHKESQIEDTIIHFVSVKGCSGFSTMSLEKRCWNENNTISESYGYTSPINLTELPFA